MEYLEFLKNKQKRIIESGFEVKKLNTHLLIIYPFLGIPVKLIQNVIITFVFTIASILRGYIVRRIFNSLRNERLPG